MSEEVAEVSEFSGLRAEIQHVTMRITAVEVAEQLVSHHR